MSPRLPPLPDSAQAPGTIPANELILHRAVQLIVDGASSFGQTKGARIITARNRARSHVGNNEERANNILRRVAGKPIHGRDSSTLYSEYIAMIVSLEDKATAVEVVAESLCGPLAVVGWTDAYEERMAAERKTFDHRPLVAVGDNSTVVAYLATLRMTPWQYDALLQQDLPSSLAIINLHPTDDSQAQATLNDQLSQRGLAPLIPEVEI